MNDTELFRPTEPLAKWIEVLSENTFRGLGQSCSACPGISPDDLTRLDVLMQGLLALAEAEPQEVPRAIRRVRDYIDYEREYAKEAFEEEA